MQSLFKPPYNCSRQTEGEIQRRRRIKHQVRARHLRDKIKPFLHGRRLLEMNAPLVERCLDDQLAHGLGRSGFKGSSYKTVRDKVRTLVEVMDFWYRRKKRIPENPLPRLDMPKASEVPNNTAPRKERRPFEPHQAVELIDRRPNYASRSNIELSPLPKLRFDYAHKNPAFRVNPRRLCAGGQGNSHQQRFLHPATDLLERQK